MYSFLLSVVVLIVGYILYGRVADRCFGADDRLTPAVRINDGVDCVPMKPWRAFLVQLLNIAGTGPIFGALAGAVFGPVVFLWIVFGSILGGAVHDYMVGMISMRHDGASIAELSGIYLGKAAKWIMRIFSIVLLVLVGAVFVTSPAALLAMLTPDVLDKNFWTIIILLYFILATLMPIDKVIGKLYPAFGLILTMMALGIGGCILLNPSYTIPEITLANLHPNGLPAWPFMFVTVACGAISGFHATQSPMVSKCLTSERQGRRVFYGAMISEAIIALIWAAAGVAFYGGSQMLNEALTVKGQSGVVYEISKTLMGGFGSVIAIVGVVACPITSGDTAFRSARLILAEITGLKQKKISSRLILTLPLLVIGALLTQMDFSALWRYFSWSNQTLAAVSLWCCVAYLLKHNEKRYASLIAAIPAAFMTAVSITYIMMAEEGWSLSAAVSYPVGIAAALVVFGIYCFKAARSTGAKQ